MKRTLFILGAILISSGLSLAQENNAKPRPTPVTRPEMKRLLEDMKERTPRIPLPEQTPEEAKAEQADPRSYGYEGRLRKLYLPASDARGYLLFAGSPKPRPGADPPRFVNEPDPSVTLDYGFKTRLFWIASRANNCQYCLGHQESKLLAVGMTDDDLAALDSNWSSFPEKEQVAFALARRLTLEPHLLTDADIEACRKHFTDPQIVEMSLSVGGNNAINRWKEGTGVPQSKGGGNFGGTTGDNHHYTTPTSEKFLKVASTVAAVSSATDGKLLVDTLFRRPQLGPAAIEAGLKKAATRKPRVALCDPAVARTRLTEKENLLTDLPDGAAIPQWMQLLAQFPVAGVKMVASFQATEKNVGLDPLLQARIDHEVARQDSAWYAIGLAQKRMKALGQSNDQIAAFVAGKAELSSKDQALLKVALNLAASPVVLTDAEVASAVELAGPADVTRTIHYTAMRTLFNRFTEAAGLPVE